MKEFKYRVSVIIPIYNSEIYLRDCINSVLEGQGPRENYEIVLVDDGSTDSSYQICDDYAKKYSNVKVIHKKNEKLSATRNRGIKEADGKYFCFLDSDDKLMPGTIDKVADFFDKNYKEVDLVTYPQIDILRDGTLRKHFRYEIMKTSGIYDLYINPFITQTRINVFSKNKGDDNVLFDTTPGFRHEDSAYNTYVLMEKMKIGFCNEGGYIYALNDNNITANYFYAYYIFETSMKYYEDMFAVYEGRELPYYVQSLVLNDLSWKLRANKLLPYHYTPKNLEYAKKRVIGLLNSMDNELILSHPDVDLYHKYFFISLKNNTNLKLIQDDRRCMLFDYSSPLALWEKISINIQKIKNKDNSLSIFAAVKHPVCVFREVEVWVIENGDSKTLRKLETTDSTYSFHRAKEKIADFRRFIYTCNIKEVKKIQFLCKIASHFYPVKFTNSQNSLFDNNKKITSYIKNKYKFYYEKEFIYIKKLSTEEYDNEIELEDILYNSLNKKLAQERKLVRSLKKDQKVWLYNDANTNIENGLLQFRYDLQKNDGVERYYIYDNEFEEIKHHFKAEEKKWLIKFGSDRHKQLYHIADKILTAYAQRNYYCPFQNDEIIFFNDLWDNEIIYLQHGILHATLPWQYGNDRMALDKIVISSNFEKKNLVEKYCYREEELITSGMVRFDHIDKLARPKNRILLAPSWRHYLIGDIRNNRWTPQEAKLLKSEYYQKYMELFNDTRLNKLLEENDLYLDFKLHPIFELYSHLYDIQSPRIKLADSAVNLSDYKICITDFSSFVFDFVYCNKPVLYFMPDYDKFISGMHTYRQLDIPLEEGFGKLAVEPDKLIENIKEIIDNNYQIPEQYMKKNRDFFIAEKDHAEGTYLSIVDNC